MLDEMNWCSISQESEFDEDGYKLLLEEIGHEITSEKVEFEKVEFDKLKKND